ncbi:MAG TPA: hypothetical protein VJ765_04785 [Chitinophagaceae bacterium]|nr:hypothetical protein [Chitinophagaceae bacterium]
MRTLLLLFFAAMLFSCGNNSGDAAKMFCDTSCQQDTIKFIKEDHRLRPYIYISASNCLPDSVIWSYSGLGTNRKLSFDDFGGHKFGLNRSYMSCYFNDTSYAWLLFNDCTNGRGYFAKIPFNKSQNIIRKGSALNKFDPKFAVADGMVAHTDRGNIFVEDMANGKKAMMTFGKMLADLDYDAMHEYIDSVNITPTRIWAMVLMDKKWKAVEKDITLQ